MKKLGWGNRTPKKMIKKKKHGATTNRGINIVWSENNDNARTGGATKLFLRSAFTFKLLESYSLFYYQLCEKKLLPGLLLFTHLTPPSISRSELNRSTHTPRHTEGNCDKRFDEFQTKVLFQSPENKQNLAPVSSSSNRTLSVMTRFSVHGPALLTFVILWRTHTDKQHSSHLQTRSSTHTHSTTQRKSRSLEAIFGGRGPQGNCIGAIFVHRVPEKKSF